MSKQNHELALMRVAALEATLIEAMCMLHMHVIHAGTNFEDSALSLFDVRPPDDIDGYPIEWEKLRTKNRQLHVAGLMRRWNSED
jgi:hypothetical protein